MVKLVLVLVLAGGAVTRAVASSCWCYWCDAAADLNW
jgi:hypothetical protein